MMLFSKLRPGRTARASERGITLFEVLLVMVIIAVLATLVAPRLTGYLGRSKTSVAQAQMSSISTALELYYLDMGQYPTQEDGLQALVESPEGSLTWQGPYFSNPSGLTDPWGQAYLYTLDETGARYSIQTLGRDGESGGEGEARDLTQS